MKNYSFLLVICAAMLFSSCGKEFSESILGTWELSSLTTDASCDEPELENIVVNNGCFTADGSTICISFTLSEDGIAVGTDSKDGDVDTYDLTYTVNNDTEQINLCEDSDCTLLTKEDGKLVFTLTEDGCELQYAFEKA